MAVTNPLSFHAPLESKMTMPMPPPLLHTRSGNETHERPSTPTSNAFVSPVQTPQGSPSKRQLPPGATDLPNVFDNALKLGQYSPTKQPGSPLKDNGFVDARQSRPESPTRQYNKENASSSPTRFQNQAALSRQEQYQKNETRRLPQTTRGLTSEELQKLQLPKVKRLANVTQLCRFDLSKSLQC